MTRSCWAQDLEADPTETTDLSEAMPEKVAELRAVVESQAGLRDEVEALRAQVRRLPNRAAPVAPERS